MRLQIKSKNMQVSDKMKSYVEKKLGKLDKLLDSNVEATVNFIEQKNLQKIEVTLPVNGFILRAEGDDQEIFPAIDLVADKLEKQILKYKARYSKKGRLSATKLPTLEGLAPAQEDDEEVKIRVKRFAVKPMNVDEAVTQMDMIGHSFFMFANAETEQINVVYRRNDGHYGLIEPEV
ncbi:MAG: ribosome-associated translation inhibitor RaiA [Peptococcaceae bacterium]|jgi:putative sigma-54 modulation protein|nr:ribosome-associated translation inhibitor RaiA [Peptococcaceae bacterium]